MDVKLPQLAEGVEGGTVVNILVAEGQEIKKDQAIMELETQKAVGSIPAPSSGDVTRRTSIPGSVPVAPATEPVSTKNECTRFDSRAVHGA